MTLDACIVNCGARTVVGLRAWTTAAAVRAGISRLGFHPYMLDKYGDEMRVAMDCKLDEHVEGEDRMRRLARWALEEVCEPLAPFLSRAAVFMGLPESRPGWSADAGLPLAREVVGEVAPAIPLERVVALPHGNASAIFGMARAIEALRAGECEVALVGGVESYIHVDTLEWLDDNGQLLNDHDSRSSFVPGEGAGFLALASRSWCRSQRVPVLARVVGIGLAEEPNRIKTDAVCTGEGLTRAIRDAVQGLDLPEDKIGDTLCDLNGERYRSEEFAFAALRNPHPFVDANCFAAPADSWGDVGAASGALLAICGVASFMRSYAKTDHVMAFAGSESGLRGAVVLGAARAQLDKGIP
ncbi:beta-ketoacyl synthase N-terminal-like domain-containing protein [Paraliomyxa miuraensis]|uniref:beta-ketoacyl synthase N-terminal-like domain-containing protein n=1 Tax=Paraliomyxa miuraensis TaxID=376150 RepID=UPI002254CB2C|nr:beta-ketoacyl synthase N-terminal-like domain-containing protein [Paraliomyxa miuraensis]MCX4239743.1 hypothetical protein [Paraliomyxa miuraensis]